MQEQGSEERITNSNGASAAALLAVKSVSVVLTLYISWPGSRMRCEARPRAAGPGFCPAELSSI